MAFPAPGAGVSIHPAQDTTGPLHMVQGAVLNDVADYVNQLLNVGFSMLPDHVWDGAIWTFAVYYVATPSPFKNL